MIGWLFSISLIVVYSLRGANDGFILIASGLFAIAGAMQFGFEKIKKIVNSRYTYDALMNDEDMKKMYMNFIKEELIKNHYDSNSDRDINYFKHRDD